MKIFKLLFLAVAILAGYTLSAQVAISTDGSDPDGSAMLDVQSTTKGFLPPRMTQAQIEAIATPANGLTVFNTTDEKLYIFAETDNQWKEIEYGEGTIAPPNLAPVASNVSFSGTMEVGETLTGSYTYADNESDLEGTSTFQWYRADDDLGTGQAAISGATLITYELVEADDAKYISFEVTPVAATGTSPGTAIMADYDGPITTSVTLAIGDSYLGGIIAYILQSSDPGYDSNVHHGLIAAESDQNTGIAWITGGSTQSTLNGNTSTDLGTGQANTNAMMAQAGYVGGAAKVCDDFTNTETGTGVYSDWYLPSKDELHQLYFNKEAIGGFTASSYWSSSEADSDNAFIQYFDFDVKPPYLKANIYIRVRPVRSF